MTLVDSNVLIDVLTDDPVWFEWSITHLKRVERNGALPINDVIYAEVSMGYPTTERAAAALEDARVKHVSIPQDALFVAGKAYVQYRRASGSRTGVLPDFFIGAHATVERIPLLTRDAKRYRHYFPALELIAPT